MEEHLLIILKKDDNKIQKTIMIKNLLLLIFLSTLILSCGKKGDPIYQEPKSKNHDVKIKVVI